ncbi:MAG TPA: hypothetical protein VN843_22080, partial [Anaerolineales bacterium]|nr:hypothetical protein [Anaerolineales bacterium]
NFMRFEDDDSGTELTNYPMANIRCYGPGIQDSSMGVNCIKVLQSGSEVTFRGIHANNMIGYIQARAAFPDSIYYEEGVPLYGPEGPGTGPPCPKIGCIVVGANARVNWDGGTLRCATGGPSETWDAIVHPNGTLNHGPNETFFSLVYGDAPIKSKVFCEGTELWEGRTERPDELSPQAQKFSGDFSKRGFLDFSVINAEWLQVGGFFLTRDEENHQLICTDSTPGSGSAVYCLSPRTMAEAGAIKEGAIWEIEFEIVSITGGYGPGLESINELSIVRSSAYMGFTNPDPDTFEVLTVGSIPGRGWRKGPYRVRAPGLIESRYDSHGNLISGDFSRGFKLSVYGGNPVEVLRLDNCHFRRVR